MNNAAGSAGPGAVTLLEGSSFCISEANGDMTAGRPQGAFFNDTRFIAEWNLTINGGSIEALSVVTPEPYRAKFVGRAASSGGMDSPLLIERERILGAGLTETVTVRNYSREPITCRMELVVDTDFADLFEAKGRQAFTAVATVTPL